MQPVTRWRNPRSGPPRRILPPRLTAPLVITFLVGRPLFSSLQNEMRHPVRILAVSFCFPEPVGFSGHSLPGGVSPGKSCPGGPPPFCRHCRTRCAIQCAYWPFRSAFRSRWGFPVILCPVGSLRANPAPVGRPPFVVIAERDAPSSAHIGRFVLLSEHGELPGRASSVLGRVEG